MKKLPLAMLTAVVVLTACQTTPPVSPALEEARSAVNAANADPSVNAGAQAELLRARESLTDAERAWAAGDENETRSRAYIARKRALIASEIGARYAAEQSLQQTGAERERIRAEARAREAQQAETRARDATQQAAGAQAQADAERQRADAERQRADAQQRQLQEERERADRVQQDLSALSAKATDRGVVVTLQDVLFDTGKADLRSGGVRSLERVASVLNKYPERRILVEGFTDSQGSEEYNMDLARRRANAVKQQLTSLGVTEQRVETRAYGEAYPVADNATQAGRQQNRRVEIVFSDASGTFGETR